MRRVDHDGLTEFLADRTGRRFRGISGSEHVANFADGVVALINNRDALFASGFVAFFWKRVARSRPGHELHDVFPSVTALCVTEFILQNWPHRSVKLFGLRHAHPMHFKTDDVETSARENF